MNVTNNGFFDIPANWLQSIIIGLATTKDFKEKLITIGRKMNIPVFLANMHAENYQVEIPGLAIDGVAGKSNYKNCSVLIS